MKSDSVDAYRERIENMGENAAEIKAIGTKKEAIRRSRKNQKIF